MMPTFPDIKPSAQSTLELKQRAMIASYGDGYMQAASYGKDPFFQEWTLVFSPLSIDQFNEILQFWSTVGMTTKFDWQSPIDQSSRKWIGIESMKAGTNGCTYSISWKIMEVK